MSLILLTKFCFYSSHVYNAIHYPTLKSLMTDGGSVLQGRGMLQYESDI